MNKRERKTTVHMIGQAHLDPVWLWRWIEGRAEAIATSKSAVDRLDEYPQFEFTRGEALVYKWISKEDSHLLERIVNYIKQGRWHVVNGMLVQPDMNLPCGEAFVRQIYIGKKYMKELLGVIPKTAYCVDSFGHAGTLPQIFKQCGFDNYVFMRPKENEKHLPQTFIWEAPDGSKILTFRIDESYETRYTEIIDHIYSAIKTKPNSIDHTMCFFGVGNHGGGPTKKQIEYLLKKREELQDIDIIFSSVDRFFDEINKETEKLDVIKDELQMHAIGCYTANSTLKRLYRKAECNLLVAERIVAMCNYFGIKSTYNKELFSLWEELSFNQFHDILAGSSNKTASDEAIYALGKIYVDTEKIINNNLRLLCSQVDTSGNGGVFFVFNPFPYKLNTYIEYEPWTDWESWERNNWNLLDEKGNAISYQLIDTEENLSFGDNNLNRIIFEAELPPMGYKFYRFSKEGEKTRLLTEVKAYLNIIENEFYKVEVDLTSGEIISCINKQSNYNYVGKNNWNVGLVLEDTSDTWSHDLVKFDKIIGKFSNAKVWIVDKGPLQSRLLIERTYENNKWIQQIILRRNKPEIIIKNKIYWYGQFKMVKLGFDVNVKENVTYHDVPFGWIKRENNGYEYPTQMYMCTEGKNEKGETFCLAIINDCKYGCDVDGTMMKLSILRCPPYAYDYHHDLNSKQVFDWLDQGLNEFDIIIKPFDGSFENSDVIQRAREFNYSLPIVTNHCHNGTREKTNSIFRIDSSMIEMSTFKLSDLNNSFVIRLVNYSSKNESCKLIYNNFIQEIMFNPFQIKTFYIIFEKDKFSLKEVNMIENFQ